MIKTLHRFFYAWLFLTKLPAPPLPKATKEDWGRIAPFFVLIGFIIGGVLYFVSKLLLGSKLPILFSSLLIVLLWVLITGGLHLDGVFDTFDGIGCKEKERKIEALKDSRIGAFGAMGGIFVILFKVISLCTILLNKLFFVVLLAPVIARLIVVYSFTFLGSNNKHSLSANLISSGVKKPLDFFINLIVFIIMFFAYICLSDFNFTFMILIFILISVFISLLIAYWLNSHFKGHSGDTYGAVIELSETVVLVLGMLFKNIY